MPEDKDFHNGNKRGPKFLGRNSFWLILLLGLLTSYFVYALEISERRKEWRERFEADCRLAGVEFIKISDQIETVLQSIAGFFACSGDVSREEFEDYSRPVLEKFRFLHTIGFISAVERTGLADLEKESGAAIKPSTSIGFPQSPVTDASKEIIFCVKYSETRRDRSDQLIGTDLTGIRHLGEFPDTRSGSGNTIATASYSLKIFDQPVLFCVFPIHKQIRKPGSAPVHRFIGYAFGIVKPNELLSLYLQMSLGKNVGLAVIEQDSDRELLIYKNPIDAPALTYSAPFNFFGRPLRMEWSAPQDYSGGVNYRQALLMVEFILILTIFLANMVRIMQAYTSKVEDEVAIRTGELSDTNQRLADEIVFRQNAEAELIKSSMTVTNILESMTEAFISFERDWKLSYINPAAERAFKRPRNVLIGARVWEIFSDSPNLKYYGGFKKVMEERTPVSFEEFYSPLESWFSVNAYPTLDGVSVFLSDVTRRRRTESELERKMSELARTNEALERFAHVISRDLDEPLRAVEGFTALLEERYRVSLDDDSRAILDRAASGLGRIGILSENLMAYSRVCSQDAPFTETDCNKTLDNARLGFQMLANNLSLKFNCGLLPKVRGNEKMLSALFQHLIGNSVKYSGAPLAISVSAENIDDEWLFCVADNGKGYDPKYAEKLFVVFDGPDSGKEYPGAGIEYAICRKIVERHGGRIWAVSDPGRGTSIYFTIPAVAQ